MTGAASDERGVLIRAENGDVVTYDATGLTLRLSDAVVDDLRARLAVPLDPAEHLGDIDAWNLVRAGDWLRFTALLEPLRGPRGYLRPAVGGDVVADAPGPLLALFSLGGPRRAGFEEGPSSWPFNVLSPADDIGAVGLEGTAAAARVRGLQRLPHATRDALVAAQLLDWRAAAGRGLPLIVVRAETDSAPSVAALGRGVAWGNFLTALDNLVDAAAGLGKRARVVSVGLDHALEDCESSPDAYAAGVRALMAQIERAMAARGLQRPVFLATFATGTALVPDHPAILGQWQLAWSHGDHLFAFSAPGYMFPQDRFGRPSPGVRARMAAMDAHALVALTNRDPWSCPLFLLAETDGPRLRVTAQALGPLVIDPALTDDPACGFALQGAGPQRISGVRIAPDDPRALVVECDGPLPDGAHLCYACGAGEPVTGALRDDWSAPGPHGSASLHRWALPARLPVRRA